MTINGFTSLSWKGLLQQLFHLTTGHDHDGVNSKAIPMPENLALADGKVLIGSAAGAAAPKTPSGDVTISNAGVTAIGAKKVAAAMVALADGKLLVGGSGGAAAEQTPSGDVTISNAGVTAIGAKKVTATMVALADGKLLIGGADGASAAQTPAGDVTISNAGATAIGAKKVTAAMVALADGKLLIGGADDAAAAQTPAGDVTISNAGATAIGAKKVTAAMVALADGKLLIGGADGASAAQTPSGDVTISNAGVTAIGADKVTPEMLKAAAKTQILTYRVEDLDVGDDIVDRVLLIVPVGEEVTLVKAAVIPEGSSAGIDDDNTSVVALSDGTHAIASKTYNATAAFPAAGVEGDLGTLDVTYKVLSAGEKLHLAVTNGAAANPPGFLLQVVYTVATAAA